MAIHNRLFLGDQLVCMTSTYHFSRVAEQPRDEGTPQILGRTSILEAPMSVGWIGCGSRSRTLPVKLYTNGNFSGVMTHDFVVPRACVVVVLHHHNLTTNHFHPILIKTIYRTHLRKLQIQTSRKHLLLSWESRRLKTMKRFFSGNGRERSEL